MTLLVAWTAIDSHGPSAVYIASDSRITWKSGAPFDFGRKVFAFSRSPDILGYSGDVLFPSIALNQVVEMADAGLLFGPRFSCKQKFQAIVDKLNDIFRAYPQSHSGLAENTLNVVHASRDPEDNKIFFCHTITWNLKDGWQGRESQFPKSSRTLFVFGSGTTEFEANYLRYSAGSTRDTSRCVFHCFCDTLANAINSGVGGAPQLVGIYRKPKSTGMNQGVIYCGKRYFLGAHIDNLRNFEAIEWRNSNFEVCDGRTMQLVTDGKSQPDPLRRL
jgi:hypothetical protein